MWAPLLILDSERGRKARCRLQCQVSSFRGPSLFEVCSSSPLVFTTILTQKLSLTPSLKHDGMEIGATPTSLVVLAHFYP